MMTHLHLNKKKVKQITASQRARLDLIVSTQEEERKLCEQRENGLAGQTPEPPPDPSKPPHSTLGPTKPLGFGPPLPSLGFPPNLGALGGFPGPRPPGFGFLPPGGSSGLQGPIRRRITDKAPMSLPSGQSVSPPLSLVASNTDTVFSLVDISTLRHY